MNLRQCLFSTLSIGALLLTGCASTSTRDSSDTAAEQPPGLGAQIGMAFVAALFDAAADSNRKHKPECQQENGRPRRCTMYEVANREHERDQRRQRQIDEASQEKAEALLTTLQTSDDRFVVPESVSPDGHKSVVLLRETETIAFGEDVVLPGLARE
ncbi:MAG: hypothetical protein AAGL69_04115 [Pseudomonadota bacterium]